MLVQFGAILESFALSGDVWNKFLAHIGTLWGNLEHFRRFIEHFGAIWEIFRDFWRIFVQFGGISREFLR